MKKILPLVLFGFLLVACGQGPSNKPLQVDSPASKNLRGAEKRNAQSRLVLEKALEAAKSVAPDGQFPDKEVVVAAINNQTAIVALAAPLENTEKSLERDKDAVVVFYSGGEVLEMGYAPYTARGLWPLYLHSAAGRVTINATAPGAEQ